MGKRGTVRGIRRGRNSYTPPVDARADEETRPKRPILLGFVLCVALAQLSIGVVLERAAIRSSPYHEDAGFPLDDAWIHLVYARSIGERLRPEYNPGVLEAGQSSLLWGVVLAPVVRVAGLLDLSLARAVRLAGILVWIACAAAAALVMLRLPIPAPRFAAGAACALIGLDPSTAFSAVSGMEPLLAAACVLFSIAALQRERVALAGGVAGLAVLSRPECVIPAALVVVAAALGPARGRVQRVARVFVPIVLLASAWVALCLAATGRPLPNTFYAKAAVVPLIDAIPRGFALLSGAIARAPCFDTYVGFLYLAMGVVAIGVRCGARLALVLLGTPILFAIGIAATRAIPDAEAFFWSRYVEPIRPLVAALTAAGMAAGAAVVVDLMKKRALRAARRATTGPELEPEPRATMLPDPVIAVVLLACIALMFPTYVDKVAAAEKRYAANVFDVDSLNVYTARWLAEKTAIPADAWVATQDAGAVRWFQERPVLDLIGLNDHELVTHGLEHGEVLGYIEKKKPAAWCLLDPDPGAAEFMLVAVASGMREASRVRVNAYSLFGAPAPKSFVVYANLPP